MEAAYNMEPSQYNMEGTQNSHPGPYPETPEGQAEFPKSVHEIVMNVPDNRGKGVYWWEPATSRNGRRTYFDAEGNAQPVINVFDKYTRR